MFSTVDAEDISQVTSHNTDNSPHRNAPGSPESSQEAKQNSNRDLSFKMLIKEMVFCIALAVTTFGALHNSPSKISKHPQAVRFFDYDSIVKDWYKGQLSNAMTSVNKADVSFVMYYAPWDAESQYVRKEFEKAAVVLGDLVHFSAINCWNPGSECRITHSKIPSWPILIAYTVTTKGLLYKGPKTAHNMVKFLELVLKPLDRMSSTEDLVSLLATCDVVAVGYTPLALSPKYYNVWHQVAAKSLEFDVMGEICFAAVTSEDLALELGVETTPGAKLLLWNETKDYKVDLNSDPSAWNVTALLEWVLENFSQPVARIIPMWKKAFSFEKYFDGNPILMLFTPLNPLYEQLPALSLLREVAMEYYDCNKNASTHWTYELRKLQHVQRLLYQQKDFTKICHEHNIKKPVRKPKKGVTSHNNKYPWSNTTSKSQKKGLFQSLEKRGLTISKVLETADDPAMLNFDLLDECSHKVFPAERSYYEHFGQCQSYEDSVENEKLPRSTSMLPLEGDPFAADNLIQEHMRHYCKILEFAKEWGPVIKPRHIENENITSIQGLACTWNHSLNVIAVDSVRNHHFAESLGIDIMKMKDLTAVVILDSKHETQYVLSEEYSAKSLRDFIRNFTSDTLKRSLRTRVEDASHTHHFGSDGLSEQMVVNGSSVHVVDLTTRTFRKFIRTPGTLSLVAVCGGVCPSHTTRSLLSATRLLTTCGVEARAARIDALRHDLPWHFTVHTYPTVLVFNAKGSGDPDSRALNAKTRISAASLIALALRSLGAPHHLRVRLALCAHTTVIKVKKTCLKDLKEHVSTLINRNLRYWRSTEDRKLKEAFLIRLQHLRQVSLNISLVTISDLDDKNVKKHNLLNSLSVLSQNWDIPINVTVLEDS